MSRFFRGGSDSESESSVTSYSSEEEEIIQEKPITAAKARRYEDSDSDSEDDVKRVVKSAKDKRFEELRASVKALENAIKINDWTVIQAEFEKLNKAYSKLSSPGTPPPGFYLRTLISIEDAVKSKTSSEVKKSMSALNSKAFNAMKQKIKKHNKTFEDVIQNARESPDAIDDVTTEDVKEEVATTKPEKPAKKVAKVNTKSSLKSSAKPKSKWFAADSDSDSSSSSSSSSSDEDSDSDESEDEKPRTVTKAEPKSNKWLKKPKGEESSSDSSSDDDMSDFMSDSESDSDNDESGPSKWLKKDTKSASKATKKDTKPAKPAQVQKSVSFEDGDEEEEDDDFKVVGKGGKVADSEKEKAAAAITAILSDVNPKTLLKKLREVIEVRGKKGTDRDQQIQILQRLYEFATTPYHKIKVQLALISSFFDYSSSMTSFLQLNHWKSASERIKNLLDLLDENPDIILRDQFENVKFNVADDLDDDQEDETHIRGSLATFVDRLDDEFTRSLQQIDPHTTEYIERLRDETELYVIIVRAQAYFHRIQYTESLASTILRRVEHIYFKPDVVHKKIESTASESVPALSSFLEEDSSALMHKLCVFLYHNSSDRLRARAILCHVFHHALHDRFHKARDMMLMSHIQESINQADIPTQILFNRAMVHIGLCAFRLGLIKECHLALQDIVQSSHAKELLAQGLQPQRLSYLSAEQEKLERSRQLPFHMHINLELLESAYLVSSMLLEIPHMAAHPHDGGRKRIMSKAFRRMLDFSERSVFNGPPENTRDHIMAAAKCMYVGEWEKATEFIMAVKIWDLIPNVKTVKEILSLKIREQSLRSYILLSLPYYTHISLTHLSEYFSLSESEVQSIVSFMIIDEEIHASLDGPQKLLVLHSSGDTLTRLQWLAGQFADKTVGFVEMNERNLDSKVSHENQERHPHSGRGQGGYKDGNKKYHQHRNQNNNHSKQGNYNRNRKESSHRRN